MKCDICLKSATMTVSQGGMCYCASCWAKKEPGNWRCKECGDYECLRWYSEINARLQKNQMCHTCDYWFEKLEKGRKDPMYIRINGEHYIFDFHPGRGLDRRHIRTLDGRELMCCYSWQGEIPEHFRDRLPDNAVFL